MRWNGFKNRALQPAWRRIALLCARVSGGGVSRNTGFEVRRCVLRNSNHAGRGVTRICRQDRQGAEYNRWSEKMKEEMSL